MVPMNPWSPRDVRKGLCFILIRCWVLVVITLVGCDDGTAPSQRGEPMVTRFSGYLDPDCFGGTCQQVGPFINGMPNPLWIAAASEQGRLASMTDSTCKLMGAALDNY